jgi:hypothetical protein
MGDEISVARANAALGYLLSELQDKETHGFMGSNGESF